jgi:hypothetical protein
MTRLLAYVRQHHVALLALFVALGGTSYAAVKLPKNSVGTKQIKSKAVTPKKVSPATIRLFKGQKGSTGNAGPAGTQGPKGDPGSAGPAGTVVARVRGNSTVMTQDGTGFTDYPLSNNAWTQGANETDLLVGQVTFTSTPTVSGCGTTQGITLELYVDSTLVRTYEFGNATWAASSTHTLVLPLDANLFEPGSDTPHTLTAKVRDPCPNAGSIATVTKLSINVLRIA